LPAVTPLTRDFSYSATAERRLCELFRGGDHGTASSAMSRLEGHAAPLFRHLYRPAPRSEKPPAPLFAALARKAAGTKPWRIDHRHPRQISN